MPVIKTKPSLNHKVIGRMTKQEVIDLHPGADEDHISAEWDKANGAEDKPAAVEKKKKVKG